MAGAGGWSGGSAVVCSPDCRVICRHAHVIVTCGVRRRVERRQLAALVEDGSALPCVMPEIDVIAKIVTYYNRWQVCSLPHDLQAHLPILST